MSKRKVCVVLTTRGNYAKMRSVIEMIEADEGVGQIVEHGVEMLVEQR